jgi:hypothetical protein
VFFSAIVLLARQVQQIAARIGANIGTIRRGA